MGITSQHLAWDIFGQNNIMPLTTWINAINSADVTEEEPRDDVLRTNLIPYDIDKTRKIAKQLQSELMEFVADDHFDLHALIKNGQLAKDHDTTMLVADLHRTSGATKKRKSKSSDKIKQLKIVFWWPNTKLLVDELEMSVSKFESLVLEASGKQETVQPKIQFKSSGRTLEISHGEVTESQSYNISIHGKGNYKIPSKYNYVIYHPTSSGILFMGP